MNRRAFSLLEISLVMMLSLLLVGLGWQSLRSRAPHEQALAQEVCAQLRAIRQHAISSRSYCALVLPGQSSQSISWASGAVRAAVVRTRSWAGEHPGSRLQGDNRRIGSAAQNWLGSLDTLPVTVFDAQGRPEGLTTLYVLGSQPWQIDIGPEGRVEASACKTPPTPVGGPASPPLAVAVTVNHPPRLLDLIHYPRVHPSMLENGVEAIAPNRGYLTLEVRAADDDGDPLTVSWSDPEGEFSCPNRQPMEWENGHWVGRVQYRPKDESRAGVQHEVVCVVSDPGGLSDDNRRQHSLTVATGMAGKFGFAANAQSDPDGEVGFYLSSPEGHMVRRVLQRKGDFASLSPDGEKLVYGDLGAGVWVANADGSDPTYLLGTEKANASFSPDGTHLAVFHIINRKPDTLNIYSSTLAREFRFQLPARTIPIAVWDADNVHVYVQSLLPSSTQDSLTDYSLAGSSPPLLAQTQLRRYSLVDSTYQDFNWPQLVESQMLRSPNEGEVRMPDPTGKLFALRPERAQFMHLVREWLGGGDYLNPAACSPYEAKSLVMEGWRGPLLGDVLERDRFLGFSLWKRVENNQRRLLLPEVIPRPGPAVWSE